MSLLGAHSGHPVQSMEGPTIADAVEKNLLKDAAEQE
jgi:hypothetical protein